MKETSESPVVQSLIAATQRLRQKGEYEEAHASLDAILNLAPRDREALVYAQSFVFLDISPLSPTIQDVIRATEALHWQGEVQKARSLVESVLNLSVRDKAILHVAQGDVYFSERDEAKNKIHMQKSLALDPSNIDARLNLCDVHIRERDFESARELLQDTWVQSSLRVVYGRHGDAIKHELAKLNRHIGYSLEAAGDREGAAAHYEAAQKIADALYVDKPGGKSAVGRAMAHLFEDGFRSAIAELCERGKIPASYREVFENLGTRGRRATFDYVRAHGL